MKVIGLFQLLIMCLPKLVQHELLKIDKAPALMELTSWLDKGDNEKVTNRQECGFQHGARCQKFTCQCRRQERRVNPWVRKIPWRRE